MYYYSTVDGIVMTHSALETDEYSMPCVRVHFERPNDNNGFDFADGRIPHFNFQVQAARLHAQQRVLDLGVRAKGRWRKCLRSCKIFGAVLFISWGG